MKWIVRSGAADREVIVEPTAEGFTVVLDGEAHDVDLVRLDGALASLRMLPESTSFEVAYRRENRTAWRLAVGERELSLEVLAPIEAIGVGTGSEAAGRSRIEAPIPGKVVAVKVEMGDHVEAGQPVVVLEAMKMENELTVERAGVVISVNVQAGRIVEAGTVLVEIE